jgi:ABC-type amino acid transport substrate-binding protein
MSRTIALFVGLLLLAAGASAAEPGGALATIKRTGIIKLGYLGSAPPFSFDRDGAPAGYTVDVCTHVAEDIGHQLGRPLRIEWVRLTQQDRLAAVRDGRVQVECGTTTWTLSRQEQVDFSLMTFIDGGSVLVRGDSELLRLNDLAGKRIGVVPGTTTEKNLRAALKQRAIPAVVTTVSTPDKGIEMLNAGQIDGYASDRVVLMGLSLDAQGANTYRLLDEDFSVEPYALTLPRDQHDLRLAVNRALARLYRSGEIQAIFDRWLGALGAPSLLLTAMYYLQSVPE